MTELSTNTHAESILDPGQTFQTISRAAREGAADAREMATRVWAGTNLFLCRFVYTTSYTISYGVVFPATLVARSIPKDNAAVRGLLEGAKAASDKVHHLKGRPNPAPAVD